MAKTKIGGITVEIGADTSDLSKKLKDVNTESKKTTSELKSIDAALKKAPDSLVLWQQKQEALTKAVENSKKKLEALVSEQENLQKGLSEGKITEDAYKAYQREIETTRGELEAAEKKLKDFKDAEDEAGASAKTTGEEIKASGDKAQSSSEGYTVLKDAVANLAADGFEKLLTSAKEAWEEIDEGYDTIIKKTGATGQALEELQTAANNVYKTLPVSMADTGAAIGEVNTRFEVTGEALEALTENFLKYSNINDTQVSSSIRNISGIMQAYQEDTSNTGKVLDTLSDVAHRTGKDVGSLESDLLSNAATFKEMDLDIRQSAELLGQFEKNGVDTSTALAGLKKAQQNAAAEGKNMTEALSDTLDRIKNAKTETEALQTATDLFGKKGSAALTQAVREQRLSIDDLSAGYEDIAEVVNTTFEATLDAPDKAQIAFNNLKLELASLAEQVLPKIEKLVDKGVKNLPQIEKTVKELVPIVKTVGIAYASWKLASTATEGATALIALAKGMKTAEGAAKSLEKVLETGTTALVFMLVSGLAELGTEIKKAHDSYVPTADRIAQKVKTAFEEQQKAIDGVDESLDTLQKSFEDTAGTADIEAAEAYDLWNELQSLADANGNVDAANRNRAEYILGKLSEAYDKEYTMTGNQIEKYQEMQQELDKVIEKKRASAYLDAYQSNSGEMAKNRATVYKEYLDAASKEQAAIDEFKQLSQDVYGRELTPEEFQSIVAEKYDRNDVWNILDQRLAELAGSGSDEEHWGELQKATKNREKLQARYNEITDYFNRLDEAQTDFEKGQYKSVERILYSQKDSDREALKSVKEKNEESLKIYEDNVRKVQAAFKLARETNGRLADSAIKDMIQLFTDTADVGLNVIGKTAKEIFTDEVRADIQRMIDEGYDISGLAKWCRENSVDCGEVFIDNFDEVVQKQLDKGFNVYELLLWGSVYGGDFADKFDAEMVKRIEKTINGGFDVSGYLEYCKKYGWEGAEAWGSEFQSHLNDYLWSFRINKYSINSESDARYWKQYWEEHKNDENDEAIQYFRNIGWYANGGYIPPNGAGIVAEAGPELLQLINGGVKVTPLSNAAQNIPVAGETVNNYVTNYHTTVNADVRGSYDVYKLAEDLEKERRRENMGKGR